MPVDKFGRPLKIFTPQPQRQKRTGDCFVKPVTYTVDFAPGVPHQVEISNPLWTHLVVCLMYNEVYCTVFISRKQVGKTYSFSGQDATLQSLINPKPGVEFKGIVVLSEATDTRLKIGCGFFNQRSGVCGIREIMIF
jgi:hypothetical protein